MNAIVTAGGITDSKEPLYHEAHGGLKSMIDLCGKPMVQWVLDALGESSQIQRVVVVGLPPEADVTCVHPLILLPDHGDMLSNIRAGAMEVMRLDPQASHAVLASGDVPGLSGAMIDWLLGEARDANDDIYYTAIRRETMDAQFPQSKRTFVHFKDAQVCGGDVHCFRLQAVTDEKALWKRLIDTRKQPLRQASLIGYDTLISLLLRQLSLHDAEITISKRLEIKARVLLSPFAEMGMDVDKPYQLEMMRESLARRQELYAAKAIPA